VLKSMKYKVDDPWANRIRTRHVTTQTTQHYDWHRHSQLHLCRLADLAPKTRSVKRLSSISSVCLDAQASHPTTKVLFYTSILLSISSMLSFLLHVRSLSSDKTLFLHSLSSHLWSRSLVQNKTEETKSNPAHSATLDPSTIE
jgi:hypothetical protein